MPKICYTPKKFSTESLAVIAHANNICNEYGAKGYSLTLRQLYYQFVARALVANKDTEYKRLGSIISDARLAGLLDWHHIEDRTRNLRRSSHWDSPGDIIASCASGYAIDKWATQPVRVEVWIEKDALVGILDAVCPAEDVPYFSCRGYTSQSEVWAAARRLARYAAAGQGVLVLHLGDHDPSGIDMSRDIADRLRLFTAGTYFGAAGPTDNVTSEDRESWMLQKVARTTQQVEVRRIALRMPQVQAHNPPPNPAKLTDSRCKGYMDRYGDESWELDALPPDTLAELLRSHIAGARDQARWAVAMAAEAKAKELLGAASGRWDELVEYLGGATEEE